MSLRARAFREPLLVAAFLIAVTGPAALAQELQFDPKSLDASGSVSTPAKPKGKKVRAPQDAAVQGAEAPAGKAGVRQQGVGPNRQFGELEGWSPGKAPPKAGEKETPSGGSPKGSMPIGVSPGGNMSVGLPF